MTDRHDEKSDLEVQDNRKELEDEREKEKSEREKNLIITQERLDHFRRGEAALRLLGFAYKELTIADSGNELSAEGDKARQEITKAINVASEHANNNKPTWFKEAEEHTKNAELILTQSPDNTTDGSMTIAKLLCFESAIILENETNKDLGRNENTCRIDRPYQELNDEQLSFVYYHFGVWNEFELTDKHEIQGVDDTLNWEFEAAYTSYRTAEVLQEMDIRESNEYSTDHVLSYASRSAEPVHER